MKKYLLIALLGLTTVVWGQQAEKNEPACDCPSCREKAASGKEFTLPGLQGLGEGADSVEHGESTVAPDHDHAEEEQAGAPVAEAVHEQDEDIHGEDDHASRDDVAGHDHETHAGNDPGDHDDHADDRHAAEGIPLSQEMLEKMGIHVREAGGGVISRTAIFPAEIKLNRDRTAAVSPRYASIVRQVFAEIGDAVNKGDVLASLENRETMAVYTVSAPLSGTIISKDLAVGETAGGDDVLYEVADLSSVWADISVFPRFQHMLRKGMPVTFIAHDGHSVKGVIKYISPIVSHETRTFTARCVLKGADEDFTPGAFVRARIVVERVDARVVVPLDAVQTIDGEPVVFTPGDHGFAATPVQTGSADDIGIEIRHGLEPNDRYVAAGAFALKAQMVTSGMDPHAGHGH